MLEFPICSLNATLIGSISRQSSELNRGRRVQQQRQSVETIGSSAAGCSDLRWEHGTAVASSVDMSMCMRRALAESRRPACAFCMNPFCTRALMPSYWSCNALVEMPRYWSIVSYVGLRSCQCWVTCQPSESPSQARKFCPSRGREAAACGGARGSGHGAGPGCSAVAGLLGCGDEGGREGVPKDTLVFTASARERRMV